MSDVRCLRKRFLVLPHEALSKERNPDTPSQLIFTIAKIRKLQCIGENVVSVK